MTNKIQGAILLVIAAMVVFGDKFSENTTIIIAAVALVGMAVWEFLEKRTPTTPSRQVGTPLLEKEGRGLTNSRQVEIKQEHLDKVLEMAKGKDAITNDEVQQVLGVSDATAERYLQELESQGKLLQVGSIGHQVSYKLVQ